MRNEMMRTASVEQLSEAMRGYAISAIGWINALFNLCGIDNTNEKVTTSLLQLITSTFLVCNTQKHLFLVFRLPKGHEHCNNVTGF
jgi:hypothetical protein